MVRKPSYEEMERRLKELQKEAASLKRAQAKLRKSDERYRAFISHSSVGIFRLEFKPPIEIDTPEDEQADQIYEGVITECNDSLARMYGYDSAAVLTGRPVKDFLDPESNLKPMRETVRCGYKMSSYETMEYDRHGNRLYFLNSCVGIIRGRKVRRMWGVQYPITERKLAEQKLQGTLEELRQLKEQLEVESFYLQEEIKLHHNYEDIIGESDALKYVLFKTEQIAPADTTVLLLGETGTGKELIARAIHNMSQRSKRPLVKVNCAALPSTLIESELFGREKGAFTGAHARQVGRFEIADGGTLFLDEIGEMPVELQPKLLRVIQDGEFERLGSSKTIKVNVRVIAATNRNLEEEVKRGHFRKDLWYRLNVFPITIPPLRHRKEDVPLLVQFFVGKLSKKLGKGIETIPKAAMDALQTYHWPGNVRELENVIERAIVNTNGPKLRLAENLDSSRDADLETPPLKTLAETEREYIMKVLERTDGRVSGPRGAALILGLHPETLRSRMRKLGIR